MFQRKKDDQRLAALEDMTAALVRRAIELTRDVKELEDRADKAANDLRDMRVKSRQP